MTGKEDAHIFEWDQAQKRWSERRTLIEKTLEIDQRIEAASDSVRKFLERQASNEKEQKKTLQEQLAIKQEITENDARQKNTEKWLKEHAECEELVKQLPFIRKTLEQLRIDPSQHVKASRPTEVRIEDRKKNLCIADQNVT